MFVFCTTTAAYTTCLSSNFTTWSSGQNKLVIEGKFLNPEKVSKTKLMFCKRSFISMVTRPDFIMTEQKCHANLTSRTPSYFD